MNTQRKLVSLVGAATLVCSLSLAIAQSQSGSVYVESAKTDFKEVIPGVSKKVLWGNPDVGPYGSFTKFGPGLVNPMHTHSSEIRIVVLKGAYIYTPQSGSEQRVGAGTFISVPAGAVHVSSGDAKEGGLFYEESSGKFDLSIVDSKSVK